MAEPSTNTTAELLRVTFGNRTDGQWSIASMGGIAIRPRQVTGTGFYEIADDVVAAKSSNFGTTIFHLSQSIVPIVAHVQGENVLRCIGTGFFVSCSGLLITAAHVISDPIERQYGGVTETTDLTWQARDLKFGVMIALNPLFFGKKYVFREIEWASFLARKSESPLPIAGTNLRITSDTAICKVAPQAPDVPFQPLTIVQSGLVGTGMSVGKTATAIGYGAMRDVIIQAAAENILEGDFPFEMHASTGEILERFPNNLTTREVPTPGACFSASLRLPGGMSGSPIFDHEGVYVHGVVSRGWMDEAGVSPLGFGSMLAQSMHIPIRPLANKTLLQLHGEDEHGFTKLRGPGM
jgi:Trypsin-like peptidase domain